MKAIILQLIINVFYGDYPTTWEKQILHAIPKNEHTTKKPKMRGIAIPPLLCKIYDSIITQRFSKWFIPNKEQSGFRKGQGCLLPSILHYDAFCLRQRDEERILCRLHGLRKSL